MPVVIEIDTADVADWLYGVTEAMDGITDQAIQWVAWFIADTMEEEAPVGRSKRLGESIRTVIEDDSITVWPDIWYANFVEDGTNPSEGAFIGAIRPHRPQAGYVGGRVRHGTHRGTPANPFVARTYERLMDEMDDFLERYVEEMVYPTGRKIYG